MVQKIETIISCGRQSETITNNHYGILLHCSKTFDSCMRKQKIINN